MDALSRPRISQGFPTNSKPTAHCTESIDLLIVGDSTFPKRFNAEVPSTRNSILANTYA